MGGRRSITSHCPRPQAGHGRVGDLRRAAPGGAPLLGRERRNHTLQPTALVNEAWLRLQSERGAQWQGRTHGLALAAQAVRRPSLVNRPPTNVGYRLTDGQTPLVTYGHHRTSSISVV